MPTVPTIPSTLSGTRQQSNVNTQDAPEGGNMDNTNGGIQVSSDYEAFKLMNANREQSRGHIETLKAAFEEMGNLTRVQPILVNEHMEIIDGQHRFTACKELGEPIYFTQVPGLGVSDARQMNILHRNWKLSDYAQSYADGGDRNYQRYMSMVESYGFSHSVILYYAKGYQGKGLFREFRDGEFTIDGEAEGKARERLNNLGEVTELNTIATTAPFAVAYLQAMNNAEFDHNRFIRRLELNPHLLTRQAGPPEYLRVIEDIYNHNMGAENRVRLF